VLSFFSAFLICLTLTPFLIRYAAHRKWFDVPDTRKIHEDEIPRLGGVAIAGAFYISTFLTAPPEVLFNYRFFLAGLLMLFFVGVWDDLQPIKPWVKLAGEFIPVLLLSITFQLGLTDVHPALTKGALPTILLTSVLAFWMVNAYNLIDGINGLAGSIGLIAFSATAWLVPEASPLSLSMAGALLAFLFFNVRNPQIFMGDSGSLLIGYCMVFLMTLEPRNEWNMPSWLLLLSLNAVPLFDMARVFVVRIARNHPPFQADRNHLHHLLLETGLTHIGATALLSLLSITTALGAYLCLLTDAGAAAIILACTLIPLAFTIILWNKVRKIRKKLTPKHSAYDKD
jgi:UDP-N-acetylmuramyl pentapeptide phosphotransferase/UDP-N-acetylglucosamine-1-phosphate transferase